MFEFDLNNSKYKHIHFIGIGGISMSGLAEILLVNNYKVSGSDYQDSDILNRLKSHGAEIYVGHSPSQVEGANLVVFTDAISLDNEELRAAINKKIDVIDRATFLGNLMRTYEKSIAVSGTHGKTSTTSMISEIIKGLDSNPTILLGGQLDDINGNVKVGSNKLFLTEACEYKANILKYSPTTAIILNIDEDHLDYFDNLEHIVNTFKGYAENLGKDDILVLNVDDPNAKEIEKVNKCRLISFGINTPAKYMAKNISLGENGFPSFELYINGELESRIELSVMGRHNIYNALAAIAATLENGIKLETIVDGLKEYSGVHRRMEKKGEYNGALILDDYAHHPTEISTTLSAIRKITKGRLFCVFQPHTFTRTRILLEGFSKSFKDSDVTLITNIYAAREKDYGDIHSKTLVNAIEENGQRAFYMSDFQDVVRFLDNNLKKDDVLVTMGAGDVYKIGEILLERI